jgi:plasmid stabilization system protein ParE
MPGQVRWHPQAVADLQRAADWYRSQDDGPRLVARLARAVSREIGHVSRAPERWPVVRGRFRQKVFGGPFPFAMIYRLEAGVVFIVAVAHQRRRPDYWAGR